MSKITKIIRKTFWVGLVLMMSGFILAVVVGTYAESLGLIYQCFGVFFVLVFYSWMKYRKNKSGSMAEGLLLGIIVTVISASLASTIYLERMKDEMMDSFEKGLRSELQKGVRNIE